MHVHHRRNWGTVSLLSISALALTLASGCGDKGGGGGGGGLYEGIAMMSSYNTAYTIAATANAGGPIWGSNATSVTANLINSSPELDDAFVRISSRCHGYRDVAGFTSLEGVSPILFQTSAQTASASYMTDAYVFSGLVAGPAFLQSNDTLTISHDDGMGTVLSASVPTPKRMTDPNDHLGTPAGLATLFRAPDGEFDLMYTFVSLSGSTGFAGASCEFPAADMTLNGADRENPLVDDATAAWIASEGLTPTDVYVAYMNTTTAADFFSRDITLQAGQMFSISASDL